MRYADYLAGLADAAGRLNDFLTLRDGRIWLGDQLDLLALAEQHGPPLEISLCPLITRRVHAMHAHMAAARQASGYPAGFVYAYATKANFAEEAVRTAVTSGAHYETSSAFDVRIARQLWENGVLPADRYVFCNGSKDESYIRAILELRQAGCEQVVPVLDDPLEFALLADCPLPLLLGVRERRDPQDLAAGETYGVDRFGMAPAALATLAAQIAATPHRLVLYHAMAGSQLEDEEHWLGEICESLQGYAALLPHAPYLHMFDFGGGMPSPAYALDFSFSYAAFTERLLRALGQRSATLGIAPPTVVGEFGRYTVADHGVHIFRVGRVKPGQAGAPPWYLLDGSLMVALPDILIVENQRFICLALNNHEAEGGPVIFGGRRTCDSDDFYPRQPREPLHMPLAGAGTLVVFCGTGAYQAMLSGEGGAHHCLAPEAPHLIFEEQAGQLTMHVEREQRWEDVLALLGYGR